MDYEKDKNEIVPEEFGFIIHPNCKICNSVYKPEIDKMILEGVMLSRIIDFCMIIDAETGKQRIAGEEETIKKNILHHRKHITIDKSKIEEAQQKSMVLYQGKVKEEVSLEKAKKLATQRMVDQLANSKLGFTLSELAIPINLEQRERSVKVEEGALQINFAKFIKLNNKNGKITGNEIKSIKNSIRELNEKAERIGREIHSIEGPTGKN